MGISMQDLLKFCLENNVQNYETKEDNGIRVSIPTTYSLVDEEYDEHYLPLDLMACHTLDNINGSYISRDTMTDALPSFAEKPILAAFVKVEDEDGNSTLDFNGHDMIVTTDKMDGESERLEYIEQIVGVIPYNNNICLVEDDESDKEYVSVRGLVYREYTYAADILEKRKTVDVSVELNVKKFSFDAEKKMLSIDEFTFYGVTLLGAHVKPGMVGSHASIKTFEENKEQEGGRTKLFEQLLEKYNIAAEDVQFKVEGMTDEEMEAKFAEVFGEGDPDNKPADDNGGGDTVDPIDNPDDGDAGDTDPEPTSEFSNKVISYEISHDDIRCALYNLLSAEDEDNYWYSYIVEVFDNHFIYHTYEESSRYFDQKYSVDGDIVAFDGERVEVFSVFVTAEERAALDLMKATYDELKQFKDNADYEANKAEKEVLLSNEKFTILEEDADFIALKENIDNYSVEEVEEKAKSIFSNFVYNNPAVFADLGTKPEKNKIDFSEKNSTENNRYGNLFND